MTIISYCYIHIVQEVRTYTKKFGVELGADIQKSISRYGKHKMDVKTTKTSALIVIGWCVAWTPYTVIALLGIFTDRSHLTPLAAHLPALFAKTAAVYNPISKHATKTSVSSTSRAQSRRFRIKSRSGYFATPKPVSVVA
nr:rhabdomeric opsin [Macrobiotus sp.]